ncbi:MAG: hypothetical protein NC307_15405 [Roseburia sp.]|nr:hypothetical protein [Roseburia sp.]
MRSQEIKRKLIQNLLYGEFGIEKESLRVTAEGMIADTDHPSMADFHMEEQISRDFAESQVEFISKVHLEISKACEEICFLQSLVEEKIKYRDTGREYVWTYSNPPVFSAEKNIRIAEFQGPIQEKTTYREYLSEKYGRVKMLFSGVHLNFSMPKEFFTLLQEYTGKELKEQKNDWYLKLSNRLMEDSWLLVALTSASPVAEPEFLQGLFVPEEEWGRYASYRNSKYGYWNLFVPELCYNSFEDYLCSIDDYVKRGMISSIQELYYPIRLKPKEENTYENLLEQGVNHIELRMLDLNLMSCAGVAKVDLIFIHLLISYRVAQMLGEWREEEQKRHSDRERILLHQKAAEIDFLDQEEYRRKALKILEDMRAFYRDYRENRGGYVPSDYDIEAMISLQETKILKPETRYCSQIIHKYKDNYINNVMQEIKER